MFNDGTPTSLDAVGRSVYRRRTEPQAIPNISQATLTLTDGTGAFAGATGLATGNLTLVPATTFFELDGPIAGTLEIPA